MATLNCKEYKGTLNILGVTAYRRKSDNKPTSSSVTLGRIDKESWKPIYNENYLPWVTEHGLNPETALKDYLIRTQKEWQIDFSNHLKQLEGFNLSAMKNVKKTSTNEIHNEKFMYTNPNTKETWWSNNSIKVAKKCSFGSIYLLNFLCEQIGLDDMLAKIFLDEKDKIKALMYFNILDHRPLTYCRTFVKTHDIPFSPHELSSQRVTEILKSITETDIIRFYNLWAQKINEEGYLALDSTSISTYSKLLSKSAYGYNKHEKLEQLNLCYIFGEESGLPVYSSIYNGCLHDVSTLIKAVKECSIVQQRDFKLVLDRGYFSKKNVDYMLFSENNADFIIGLPATTILNRSLIDEFYDINENINYAIQFHGDTIFTTSKRIKWDNKYLYAHVYIDPRKNDKNRDIIVSEILSKYHDACQNPKDYVDDPDYQSVLTFRKSKKSPSGYTVKRNNAAYNDFRSREGWFILISNKENCPLNTLEIYRNRYVAEKAFDIIKQFKRQKRTRVHSDEAYESKIFIGFLSMILISIIHKGMKDHHMYKDKTMEELLSELSAVNAVIVNDQFYIVDPLTKQIKNYFDIFGCPYPDN